MQIIRIFYALKAYATSDISMYYNESSTFTPQYFHPAMGYKEHYG
jgi:hypothetical protein